MKTGISSTVIALGVLLLGSALLGAGASLLDGHVPTATTYELTPLVGLGVTIFGILVLLWCCLGFCAALATELLIRRGRHHAAVRVSVLAPTFLRRLACLTLGTSLVAAQPAYAKTDPASAPAAATAPVEAPEEQPGLTPQWMPVEQSRALQPSWQPTALPPAGGLLIKEARESRAGIIPAVDEVLVRPGDSLWTIAARHLGPRAADTQIAETWPLWYAANKHIIGDDPDLLHPGQVLRPPVASPTPSK